MTPSFYITNARLSGEQLVASPAAESRDALGVC